MELAVIVVDMINDFVRGKFGFERAGAIVPNIKRLLEFARKRNIPIIYACDAHSPQDPELERWGPHAMAGSEGAQVVPELEPAEGETIVEKRTYDIFFGTELDEVLRGMGIKHLVLTGVVTEICVQNSAAGAFFRGYKISVLRDCVASPDEQAHEASLDYMRKIYGAKVIDSGELMKSV